jgi:hypothetical protein
MTPLWSPVCFYLRVILKGGPETGNGTGVQCSRGPGGTVLLCSIGHLGAGRNKWRGYLRFGAACEKRRAVKRWLGPIYWEDYMIRASFGYWLNLGLPA